MIHGSIDAHLAWCAQRNLTSATIASRGYVLRRLRRRFGGSDLLELSAGDLGEWWAERSAEVLPETRAAELMHVRHYYRWAALEGIGSDVTVKLQRPRLPRRLPRPIGEESVRMALDEIGEPARTWLVLAAFAGLRAKEIAGLRAQDVRREIRPAVLLVAVGKGGHMRVVPACDAVLDALPVRGRGPLWVASNGRPYPPYRVSQICNRALHSIGIPETLHQFRHRFGTAVYADSRDLRLTQELLGHASPVTTAGYAAWSPGSAAEVVARIGTL